MCKFERDFEAISLLILRIYGKRDRMRAVTDESGIGRNMVMGRVKVTLEIARQSGLKGMRPAGATNV
jgi:hypothetical protein